MVQHHRQQLSNFVRTWRRTSAWPGCRGPSAAAARHQRRSAPGLRQSYVAPRSLHLFRTPCQRRTYRVTPSTPRRSSSACIRAVGIVEWVQFACWWAMAGKHLNVRQTSYPRHSDFGQANLPQSPPGVSMRIGWFLGRRDQITLAQGAGRFTSRRWASANFATRQSPREKKHESP